MTFEEAKKILEKEGFYVEKATRPCAISESFFEYEDPTICEAMQVVNSAGYFVCMEMSCFDERKARLKKELEEHANAPVSGKEQPKEKKGIIYPSTSPKADFYYKHVLNEGNPALKEAASQFNDALLDEQGKKIESLEEKCKKYAYVVDSLEDKLRELKSENRRIRDSDLNLEGLTYATRELKEKNKKIDEQNKETTRLLSLVEKKENSISRLYYEKSVLEKENEDLKKGEIPARYFDKALVDEQAEKIKKLEHEKLDILEIASSSKQTIAEQAKKINRLGKEISRLNGIIHDKNEEIKRKTKGCCELVAENVDLKEDLRNTESLLHDTREANSRNLDTCFKNEDLIDELKKKLAEKTKLAKKYAKELSDSSLGLCKLEKQLKDKDAVLSDVAEDLRLTKIREKNLAELGLKYVGENEKLKKKLADKVVDKIDAQALKSAESALAYKEKVIAEKDEVIDKLTKENNDYKKVVEEFRNKIADMTIGKIEIQNIRLKEKDEVIGDLGKELAATKKELEEKTKLVETVRKGSKEYCEYGIAAEKMIRKMANVIVYEGKVSSKEFEEYRRWANGYRYNPQLYDFIEEEEKKFSPVKDTHPTEDNPEEIEMDEILERVRKALEEGHTVSIDYDKAEEGGDPSGVIVLCGKDFVKKFKENEDLIHDLFEKKHKEIKEFMSAEAEQLFEGDGIPTKMEVMKPSRKFKKIK